MNAGIRSSVVAMVVVALATSCASSGPSFERLGEVPEGKAVIYVYRPWSMRSLVDIDWPVAVDGNAVGSIGNGEYIAALVEPGLHSVSLQRIDSGILEGAQSIPVDVDIAARQSRYVQGVFDQSQMNGNCCVKFTFVSVEERDALKDIGGTKRADN